MVISTTANQQLMKIFERQHLIPTNVLESLSARARTLQEWLGQVAVEDGLATYEEIALAISKETKIPLTNVKISNPDLHAVSQIPMETCRSYIVIPVSYTNNTLTIAMANPMDEETISVLRKLISCELAPRVAPMDEILIAIDTVYSATDNLVNDNLAGAATTANDTEMFERLISSLNTDQSQYSSAAAIDPHEITIDQLLYVMMENRASDLHLAVGSPPMMRVDGELVPMTSFPKLIPSVVQTMLYAILNDVQITEFERKLELDFAYSIPRVSRFRVNVHRQRGSVGAVMRTIPEEMPTLDKLRMPSIVREMTERPRGLVLVTGPTGSGKSTTLAAMIDEINRTRRTHIVTIEDPIEFLHKNKMSVITQREVGADTESFTIALRHVLTPGSRCHSHWRNA